MHGETVKFIELPNHCVTLEKRSDGQSLGTW